MQAYRDEKLSSLREATIIADATTRENYEKEKGGAIVPPSLDFILDHRRVVDTYDDESAMTDSDDKHHQSSPTFANKHQPGQRRRRRRRRRGEEGPQDDSDQPCSDSPDPSRVEDVEKVPFDEFNAAAGRLSVTWLGAPRTEMLVLARGAPDGERNLYFSADAGKTYALADGVPEPISDIYAGPETSSEESVWIYALPTSPTANYYFLSKDSGLIFTRVSTPFHFTRLLPHGNTQGLILAMREDSGGFVSVDTVYLSENAGAIEPSYRKLIDDVLWVEWLARRDETLDAVDTLLMTRFSSGVNKKMEGLDLVRWEAPFTSGQEFIARSNCYKFEQEHEFLLTTEVPAGAEKFNERNLWVSTDEGRRFNRAQFPFSGRANHYKVVDASEGAIMAVVQHSFTRVEGVFRLEVYDEFDNLKANYSAAKALFSPVVGDTESEHIELTVPPQGENVGDGGGDGGNGGASTPSTTAPAASLGCSELTDVAGKIVILDRGTCTFATKVANAEAGGAVGVVVVALDDEKLFRMSGEDHEEWAGIPAYLISKSNGDELKAWIRAGGGSGAAVLSGVFTEDDIKERYLWKESHLYASDASGLSFSTSLKNVAYTPESLTSEGKIVPESVDFYKVESQPGTFIANIIYEHRYVSAVTMNKGAHWRLIPSPDGERCRSEDTTCGLHISLDTTYRLLGVPLPLSTATAAGIVVANAFIGTGIGAKAEYADVYLSRDGGYTWHEARQASSGSGGDNSDGVALQGPHLYRIMDHGGIIAATPTGATDSVWFTANEGLTGWQKLPVTETAGGGGGGDDYTTGNYLVMSAEPGGRSTVLYVFYADFISQKWRGVFVNFEAYLGRECEASTEESDFVDWSPGYADLFPSTEDRCLIGQHRVYRRRAPCRLCINGVNHEIRRAHTYNCECARYDYACAPGFFRANAFDLEAECVYDYALQMPIACSGTTMMQHYRKVVGDGCTSNAAAAEEFEKSMETKCTAGANGFTTFVLVTIVLASVLGGIFTTVMFVSPGARARVMDCLGTGNGCMGRLSRLIGRCACQRQFPSFKFSALAEELNDGGLNGGGGGNASNLSDLSDEEMLFGDEVDAAAATLDVSSQA